MMHPYVPLAARLGTPSMHQRRVHDDDTPRTQVVENHTARERVITYMQDSQPGTEAHRQQMGRRTHARRQVGYAG